MIATKPITTAAIASPRPFSPVRLICDRAMKPRTMPTIAMKNEAMKPMMFKALVVESYWDDLFLPKFYSSISPEVIRQSLVYFEQVFRDRLLHYDLIWIATIFQKVKGKNTGRYRKDFLPYMMG